MAEPEPIGWFALVVAGATLLVTHRAFQDPALYRRLLFCPRRILAGREYHRVLSVALVHIHWPHAFFNCFALYLFGSAIELEHGAGVFLAVYLLSVLGGSGAGLFLHRNHDYQAGGASGGVCGLAFAYVFLFPGAQLGLLLVPVYAPAWIWVTAFLVISLLGARFQAGSVAHDAHLGGAAAGLVAITLIEPSIVGGNPVLYPAVALIFVAALVYVLFVNPLLLPPSAERPRPAPPRPVTPGGGGDAGIDDILDKISRQGMGSLTRRERRRLEKHSRR